MLKMLARADMRGISKKVLADIEKAQRTALSKAEAVIKDVVLKTIGTQYFSAVQIKAMRGPYSARNPHPPMPPGIINAQNREFYESRRIVGPTKIGNRLVLAFYITSEKTDYLNARGTDRMMGRDYKTLLQSRLRRQLSSVLTGNFAGMIHVKVKG